MSDNAMSDNLNELNFKILDHGYLRYVSHMGSDEAVVEAARMSTGKGFLGWYWPEDTYADVVCWTCRTQHLYEDLPENEPEAGYLAGTKLCTNCWSANIVPMIPGNYAGIGFENLFSVPDQEMEDEVLRMKRKLLGKKGQPKDLSLLETLMANRHSTPFEMGDLIIEVNAPIMVLREWHRHRTQSYNEMSGRYIKMPAYHYIPPLSRIQRQSTTNKQGSGDAIDPSEGETVRATIQADQHDLYRHYEWYLEKGISKEISRINTPVARYSRMRAKANLRNWLGFLSLRMDLAAQWEIRQYAMAVASIVKQIWPKSFELWMEHEFMGKRFSRTESRILAKMFGAQDEMILLEECVSHGMSEKEAATFLRKVVANKDSTYADTLAFLEERKGKESKE